MGTHSTVHFYTRGQNILNIYNQYDGYLSGEGRLIIDFFKGKDRGNGFDDDALMYVLKRKQGAYHTYATTERDTQEFNYYIHEYYDNTTHKTELLFTVTEEKWISELETCAIVTLLRNGTLEEFEELIVKEEAKIENLKKAQ